MIGASGFEVVLGKEIGFGKALGEIVEDRRHLGHLTPVNEQGRNFALEVQRQIFRHIVPAWFANWRGLPKAAMVSGA